MTTVQLTNVAWAIGLSTLVFPMLYAAIHLEGKRHR